MVKRSKKFDKFYNLAAEFESSVNETKDAILAHKLYLYNIGINPND